jgi:integrase
MASIKKRGKTWGYAISHTVNGKSKLIRKGGFRTQSEAKAAAIEIESQLNNGLVLHLKSTPIDEYFDNWAHLYKGHLAIATLKHFWYTSKLIKEFFSGKPLQQISKDDYQEFLNHIGINKSKKTVEKVNGHIRACVQNAIEQQIIHRDFTRNTVLKFTVPAKKANEKHLNYMDSKLLLKEFTRKLKDGLVYYLLLLGLVTGLRFEELVGLTFNDFDFENNKLRVDKTWGYNNRMSVGFCSLKNTSSDRIIVVDKKTMGLFKELFKGIPDNPNHLVFYNQKSIYKVITNEQANDVLKEVLREINIRPLISAHALRHTHTSVLIYKKASWKYVSERLGHSDIETTLKIYTHLLKEAREEDEKLTVETFENMHDEDEDE